MTDHPPDALAERPLLALPELPAPDPETLLRHHPVPPEQGGTCGNPDCRRRVGAPFPGTPTRYEGFCRHCGTPYSLLPQLTEGEPLDGGRYTVRGCLAHGGLGWVYLAVDTRLRDRPVALKGVLNPHDPGSRARMLEERDQMVAIAHDSVVRIHDYFTHPLTGDLPVDYIVMEFVGGKSLGAVMREAAIEARPLGRDEPLTLEHVARYGCQILSALQALHEKGLVYADMKPDNVIHRGSRVVLIDLGGVQTAGDRGRMPVITHRYASPEVTEQGLPPEIPHDIHTVGRTLRELADAVEERPADYGLGTESFDRLLDRAVAVDPRRRFATATEMGEQLEGVLRELASLRTGRAHTRASTVFDPTPALLDAGLGTPPGPARWHARRPRDYRGPGPIGRVLGDGQPAPDQVAVSLPVPRPDPRDAAGELLRLPAPRDPRAAVRQLGSLLRRAGEGPPSVEVPLQLCRAHLRIRAGLPDDDPEVATELGSAREWLERAAALLDDRAPGLAGHDWRIAWHRGLLALGENATAAARDHFDDVYTALPGEYAPKLALGYCAERERRMDRAQLLYHAVWRRNPQQESAAFGLARIHLARGERAHAAQVLDRVSTLSRHYDAARVAAVRIRAARLSAGPAGLPDWPSLSTALRDLAALPLDGGAAAGPERTRLTAELVEWALDRARLGPATTGGPDDPGGPGGPDGEPAPPSEDELRIRLADALRRLAQLTGTTQEQHERLIDCFNAVHPRAWLWVRAGRRDRDRPGRRSA
jgi:serine/threonine-protein kinase PknG